MTEITQLLADPAAWIALATLIVMEIVLGIGAALVETLNMLACRARRRRSAGGGAAP